MSLNLSAIHINQSLLLENEDFADQMNNIDHLSSSATLSNDLNEQHHLLSKACKLCEKFHSYFHFEESFFRLEAANLLMNANKLDEAIAEFKLSIFQNHLNKPAHQLLIKCYDQLNMSEEKKAAEEYATSLNISSNSEENLRVEKRPFDNFSDYIHFATSKDNNSSIYNIDNICRDFGYNKNFWTNYHGFKLTNEIKLLTAAIAQVKACHQLYHKNAAILYYNHSMVYKELGEIELSNNSLIKSQNLFK